MCPSSLLLAVIATLAAVGLAHWLRRWMAFRALARSLGGTGGGRGFQASLGGVQYTCRYSGGSRSEPSRLIVAIDLRSGPPSRVGRSTVGSRICLVLGLGRTVGPGDPTLDQEHVVACDAGDRGTAVVGAPDARAAVTDLLGSGFTEVRADGSRLVAEW